MSRALVIVDIQNDYFPGGAHPLVGPEAAAANAQRLLERVPASGEPVVHIQHVWDAGRRGVHAARARPASRSTRAWRPRRVSG